MIVPQLPSQHFKTYQIIAPLATHWRAATCAEIQCGAYVNGWKTIVPADSPQAVYIESGQSGRKFQKRKGDGAGIVEFWFYAGQQCFASSGHRVPLERDPIFIARGGDARGNPTGERRVHTRPEHWVEDCSEHLDKVRQGREG